MYQIKLIFILILLSNISVYSQKLDPKDGIPIDVPSYAPCLTNVSFEIQSPYDDDLFNIADRRGRAMDIYGGYDFILNPSCGQSQEVRIAFDKTGHCQPIEQSRWFSYLKIEYSVEVYFNREIIYSEPLSGTGSSEIVVQLSQEHLNGILTPNILPLELKVRTTIITRGFVMPSIGGISTSSRRVQNGLKSIMIVSNNDELIFEHRTDPSGENSSHAVCRLQYLDESAGRGIDYINCDPDRDISIETTRRLVRTNSDSRTFTGTYGLSFESSAGQSVSEDITIEGTVNGSIGETVVFKEEEINGDIITQRSSLILPRKLANGPCSFLGVTLICHRAFTQKYIVTCNGLDSLPRTNKRLVFDRMQLRACREELPIPRECLDSPMNFRITFGNGGRNIKKGEQNNNDCTISINTFQDEIPDYQQSIRWVGPNGNEYIGSNLQDVPAGIYTVSVFDECGEETNYTVDPCPAESRILTPWVYDEEKGTWCRSSICSGYEECDGLNIEECVEAEYGEWSYDPEMRQANRIALCPGNGECTPYTQISDVTFGAWDYIDNGFQTICQRPVVVMGQEIAMDEHPAQISYDYDDFTQTCYKYIKCEDPLIQGPTMVMHTDTEQPDYEDWSYNDFSDVCVRKVRCFDLTEDQIEADPNADIENDFNLPWENSNDYPNYRWEYDAFWGCTGYIFCDPSEPPYYPNQNEDWIIENDWNAHPVFESTGYDNNFGTISCILDVSCNYKGVLYETPRQFPPLLSAPIEPSSAALVGTIENNNFYCTYRYNCGDQPPYFLDKTYTSRPDPNNSNRCIIYCPGFEFTTSRSIPCQSSGDITGQNNTMHNNSIDLPLGDRKKQPYGWENPFDNNPFKQLDKILPAPNPFKNEIILTNIPLGFGKLEAQLINSLGQVILIQIIGEDISRARISTKELPEGTYFLVLSTKQNQVLIRKQLIKVR